jgi:hypothetical protein
MIRYEIECRPAHVLDAPGIRKITATRGRTAKAIVIVHVEEKDSKNFEKAVEGDANVLGYHADRDGTGKEERKYARVA